MVLMNPMTPMKPMTPMVPSNGGDEANEADGMEFDGAYVFAMKPMGWCRWS
jgi:hypothetical protein